MSSASTPHRFRFLINPGEGAWPAAWQVCVRELRLLMLAPGTYLIGLLAGLAAHLFLGTFVQSISESGLAILSGTFNLPIYSLLMVNGLYLALASVMSIARECEQGTLETLFYGPMDALRYVLGKLGAYALAFAGLTGLYLICYAVFSILTRFSFPAPSWAILGLSLPVMMHLVSLGALISATGRRIRVSLAWFLVFLLVLLGLQFGPDLLELAPSSNRFYPPMRLARVTLERLNLVSSWLSPFGLLIKGTEAVRRGDLLQFLQALAVAAVSAMIFAAGSVFTLRWKGVRP